MTRHRVRQAPAHPEWFGPALKKMEELLELSLLQSHVLLDSPRPSSNGYVSLVIVDSTLKRCTRPSAGAPSKVHRWRELSSCNPSIQGRTTQCCDADYICYAKERRIGRMPWINDSGFCMALKMHDKSSRCIPFQRERMRAFMADFQHSTPLT
jgi:hypothetical protein